jgi:FKBP-type peptidyl-prolyl cis-trans isomerase FklB
MKLKALIPLCAIVCANVIAADPANTPAAQTAAAPVSGPDAVNKGSYAVGASVGKQLRAQGGEANVEQIIQGLRDGVGGKVKLTDMELRQDIAAWQRDVRGQQMVKNKKAGDEFIAKKAKEPGVKKLPSGVLYKVLATGKGPQPKATDQVSAHYKGTLTDGTEFDSSYTRGQPFNTAITRVIPGWQDALTNMHVGDKWELYVPSDLAYGERGQGMKIGPNAALVFEMELLSILPPGEKLPGAQPAFNVTPGATPPNRPAGVGQPQIRVAPAQPQATPAPKK